jgi:hypothetical protein
MSDRILVMRRGRAVAKLPGRCSTQEEIMYHAAGKGASLREATGPISLKGADP